MNENDVHSSIERAPLKNPSRIRGKMTEEEMEVKRIYGQGIEQKKETFRKKTYQYWCPFNYPNIKVELGRPGSNAEFNPDGVELDVPPHGAITIVENEPIVEVDVIGNACVAPGYVFLIGEPVVWKYPRTGVKMKVTNLWGQHVHGKVWKSGVDEGTRSTGLSSAHFAIPECKKISLMGGGQTDLDVVDDKIADAHYTFRIIRVTVKESAQ